jgi:hypothetical protein
MLTSLRQLCLDSSDPDSIGQLLSVPSRATCSLPCSCRWAEFKIHVRLCDQVWRVSHKKVPHLVRVFSQVNSGALQCRLSAEGVFTPLAARTGDLAHPPPATQSRSPKQEVEPVEGAECLSPVPNAFAISHNSRNRIARSDGERARSNDHVVETLAANRTNHSFTEWLFVPIPSKR